MAAVHTAWRPSGARPGFLLLEALIGFALFALFLTAVGLTMLVSQQGTSASSQRSRAIALTQAALEGVRAVRNTAWSAVPTGTRGVVSDGGVWAFSDAPVTTTDGFTTSVTLSAPASGRITAAATTVWRAGPGASGSVVLRTELTDWRETRAIGNWASPQLVGAWTTASTPLFNKIAVSGNTAVVTSETSAGGDGLYLFDISLPASPQRIATGFSLGFAAHDVLIVGNTLIVATEDPAAELKLYSLQSPSSFSAAALVGSYDVPGSGRAVALALRGDTLVVGARFDLAEAELLLLDITDPEDPSLQNALDLDGGVTALALLGPTLLIATDDDAGELRLSDISDPSSAVAPSGSGYNLTDTVDASAIAATGTAAVVGRLAGEFIEELTLFTATAAHGTATPPGPWYWEVGDGVNALSLDPSQQYGFAATGYASREFSVLDLPRWENGLQTIVGSITSTTGEGRGVLYDPAADRAYHVTRQTFSIFRPS